MSDSQIPVPSLPTASLRPADDAPDESTQVNPLLRIHALLYGRYPFALSLGIILGIAGAALAYYLTPPKYEIVGYIRVKPFVPKILYPTDQTGYLPSFDTYVSLQESLIQSQRVMDHAAKNPAWLALHRKPAADGTNPVSTESLVVDHEKGTELITVSATDRDLNVAMAAVKSIIKAYTEISDETENEGGTQRLQALEDLRSSLSNQQRDIRDQILAIANEDGTDDLTRQRDMKTEDASRMEAELQEIELAIAQASPDQQSETTQPATQPVQLTREDVAAVDVRMQRWIADEDQAKLKLEQLHARYGDNSPEVRAAVTEINFDERNIGDLLSYYEAHGGVTNTSGGRDRSRMSIANLTAQRANIKALYDKIHAEAVNLGRKDLQIKKLKDEEERITKRLNEASSQIEQQTLEAPLASRISVLSDGEKPTTPPKSKRLPMTAAGGVGGMSLGVGIVALWGLADRRLRSFLHIQQLQPAVSVLGVLPILPEEFSNPEQKQMAAHCVHQIRTRLDTGDHIRGRVLAITSPSAGDGKTSLSLALGLSFAGAGYRTLMVDCDIVGGGLTGRLSAVCRRGPVGALYNEKLLTKAQLNEIFEVSATSGVDPVEVLRKLGYATDADIKRFSVAQHQTSVGLMEALNGDPVCSCVTPVLTRGLFVLPLGDATVEHTNRVSPKAFRRLISDARDGFDVVIVDTGPILGSLEASIVVREVDEVVMTVAQNGSAPLMTRALRLMESLGVAITGLVFNRAKPSDVAFASYGSSSSNVSTRSVRGNAPLVRDPSKMPRLGSLVAAVVNSSESTVNDRSSNVNSRNGLIEVTDRISPEGNEHDNAH